MGLALTVIGDMRRGSAVVWCDHGREFALSARGYDYFR
jgi:hypothetical protein